VKLDKIAKTLRREVAANPKKATFLGVMALVALYLWMPLVRGWLSVEKATPEAGAAAEPSVAASTTAPPARTTASDRPTWREIIEWMPKDSRTMIAPSLSAVRDPFELPKEQIARIKGEDKPEMRSPTPTAGPAGLLLTSTIIGPQRRVAQINGKTYAEGQAIDVGREHDAAVRTFHLVEIHPRRAVLQCGEDRLELVIPEPGDSQKIEITEVLGGK
jgi:hypothetical protein